MKRYLLLFVIYLLNLSLYSQVTNNPQVDYTSIVEGPCVRVVLTPTKTYVYVDVRDILGSMYSLGASIEEKTFLYYLSPQDKKRYKLQAVALYASNINNKVKFGKNYVDKNFYNNRYLIIEFGPIPIGVSEISVMETNCHKPSQWKGIHINPRVQIYKVPKLCNNQNELDSLIASSKNPFVGEYEQVGGQGQNYKLALIEKESNYYLIYLGSKKNTHGWTYGEMKAKLRPSEAQGYFKGDWYMAAKNKEEVLVRCQNGIMKVSYTSNPQIDKVQFLKMGEPANKEEWTGSGFALKDSYVITNEHVANDAKEILVYGVNGDFTRPLKAVKIGADKSNDLALLKIQDEAFSGFGNIPYKINFNVANVGEKVYALGFPEPNIMGQETKLTNGIISSKSGLEGNVSLYQISAPIQPGNSGGPLLNSEGDIVGVIVSKLVHAKIENVSYAIKASYIKNLVESLTGIDILPTNNDLEGKEMKEQTEMVKPFVFLIKCSK